ncbi:AI-2E family transporter [Candidatus Roizmanbacteria bacterium]|nr:AI-2E family transporter [Candidatus Roizmanbacteria bacterium]
MNKVYKIEISAKTIIFTIAILLLLKLLFVVKELIFSVFIAFIVMSALNPLVSYLKTKKIPRGISSFFVFVLLISGIVYLLTWILPLIIQETRLLLKNLPVLIENLNRSFNLELDRDFVSTYIPNITTNAFVLFREIFSNLVFIISTLFFSFYFLVEENVIRKFFLRFFETRKAHSVAQMFDRAEKRMRAWFWGELTLMVVIGVMTFIGLNLIGVRYPIPLSIIAGLLEIVPVLGPIVSAVPALIVASSDSYFLGLATVALYFVIQQLENQVVVPLVMRRVVGLNPVVTLAALIVGGKVAGVVGILLAIPTTLFVETILVELAKGRALENQEE